MCASSQQEKVLQQQPDGNWLNVSEQAGLRVRGFGMGCFTADFDNDGDPDAVTTGARGVLLFRNDTKAGQIRMVDVTAESLVSDSRWATAAVMFDYDRDGWLDLFVTHYVDYFPGSICADGTGRRDYCGPQSFQGTA
ncbi:MAG: FG-GAP repeat domain-containing protein, partial [Planctomycetaceae bacterium]